MAKILRKVVIGISMAIAILLVTTHVNVESFNEDGVKVETTITISNVFFSGNLVFKK